MASGFERSDIAARFGANLRHCRTAAGLSQEEVAFLASLHRTEISLLERGKRVPRIDTLIRLITAVSASPADLLDGITWDLPIASHGAIKVETREDE